MASSVNVGDVVRFLNTTGGGVVSRIEGNMAYVTDEDGFDTPVLMRECVVVDNSTAWERATAKPAPAKSAAKGAPAPAPVAAARTPVVEEPEVFEEFEGGDSMNLILGFEAEDLKKLSETTYFSYLVNDSNYYLSFVLLASPDGGEWTTRCSGTVEPGMQILLEELGRDDVASLENIALQAVSYKKDRAYAFREPVSFRRKIDVTKFFKLHCFRDNPYFETPVIAIDIVKNDVVQNRKPLDTSKLIESVEKPKPADRRKWKRPVVRNNEHAPGGDGIIQVDLHIDELVDTTAGLSNADMLNLQIDEFRKVMDANLKKTGTKIVFIHGKGEGVLRNALMKELNHRYKGKVEVQDASFREYGFGATQVTVRG